MKKIVIGLSFLVTLVIIGIWGFAQDNADLPKGVGPIETLELTELDPALAETGKVTFEQFCSACHKIEERYIGPALLGVTERRAPEWIMNMILNPDVMIQEDDTAYELFAEYLTPMANQHVSEEQARSILEYFRSNDAQ